MPANLCIVHVEPAVRTEAQVISFFESDNWSSESETMMVAKIQELLSITRSFSQSIHIAITIQTEQPSQVLFLINKKNNAKIEINNQKLSIREIEVLGLIMQGMTNREIAEKLFVSYETVKSHRKNILEKTGARNTAALIHHYHQTFFEK